MAHPQIWQHDITNNQVLPGIRHFIMVMSPASLLPLISVKREMLSD